MYVLGLGFFLVLFMYGEGDDGMKYSIWNTRANYKIELTWKLYKLLN